MKTPNTYHSCETVSVVVDMYTRVVKLSLTVAVVLKIQLHLQTPHFFYQS